MIEWAIAARPYVLYDGTNDHEVRELIASRWSGDISSQEIGDTLTVEALLDGQLPTRFTVGVGDRISSFGDVVSAADWATSFVKVPTP